MPSGHRFTRVLLNDKNAEMHRYRQIFQHQRWCKLFRLLSAKGVRSLAAYTRSLWVQGNLTRGDQQCSERFILRNDPIISLVHERLASLVEEISSLQITCSNNHVIVYPRGAVLNEHTDRAQSALTLNINIENDGSDSDMSFWIGPTRFVMNPGDAILFNGTELPHRRSAVQHAHVTNVLFHFVGPGFKQQLD